MFLKNRGNFDEIIHRRMEGQAPIGPTQGSPQAPAAEPAAEKWREMVPESLRTKPIEEIVKWGSEAHKQLGSLNNDLGGYKTKISDYEKQLQQSQQSLQQHQQGLQQWAGWWDKQKADWAKYEAWKAQQNQGGGHQQPQGGGQPSGGQPQHGDEIWGQWDTMSAADRARAMNDYTAQQVQAQVQAAQVAINQQWQQYQQGLQQYVGNREQYFQNLLNIQNRVWEEKQKNPNLDVNAMMQEAIRIQSGQFDPIAMGVQISTQGQANAKMVEDAKKLAIEEYKQSLANQQVAPPLGGSAPPPFRISQGPPKGPGAVREAAAQALATKFGPGVF